MKQLVEKMKKLVLESEPNIYYDQMLAVVNEMETALTEKSVEAKPTPKKTAKPKSAETSVEETVAKAVSKKAKKTTKTETSTEE